MNKAATKAKTKLIDLFLRYGKDFSFPDFWLYTTGSERGHMLLHGWIYVEDGMCTIQEAGMEVINERAKYGR